jgi:hypothetical protein
MPEVILCRYCKQSINKEADQYVVIEKGSDKRPEALAHAACEQKIRPRSDSTTGYGNCDGPVVREALVLPLR